MPSKQIWLTRTKELEEVIDEARRTFPDADTDAAALNRALFHWFHGREENSKRGAMYRIEKDTKEILAILRGEQYDTDHG